MGRYVSILRGINVGGHKKILMADLKKVYDQLGYKNIVTYIQSGNVIFDSSIEDKVELAKSIKTAIKDKYKFDVPIILRSQQELESVINDEPFAEIDKHENASKIHVFFLSEIPDSNKRESLANWVSQQPEEMILNEDHAYVYYPNGAGRSQLTTTVIERKLVVQATARNWKTTLKLLELSKFK